MHVLIALEDQEVRQMAVFSLESCFDIKIGDVGTAKKAVEYLEEFPDVRLVIADYPGVGTVLFKYLSSMDRKHKQVSTVVCSLKKPPESDPALKHLQIQGFASMLNLVDSLYEIIERIQPVSLKKQKVLMVKDPAANGKAVEKIIEQEELSDSEFCRIRTNLLVKVGRLKAGVYIRLSKSHYIKLFQEGDVFDDEDYRRYMLEKKIEYFYLRLTETAEFISKFKVEILKVLNKEPINKAEVHEISLAVHETIQEMLNRVGPTSEVQDIVKTNIMLSMKAMGQSPKLNQVLKVITNDTKKYISSHSIYLAQLSCALAVAMKWSSETSFHKLNLAAFLHDMALTDQKLASMQTMKEFQDNADSFEPDAEKKFKLHPIAGADIARQFSEIPADVDTIIQQHHEQPDGSGFPRGLSQIQMSPLACIFIVAHDVVTTAMRSEGKFDLEAFIEKNKDKYTLGNYKKAFKCLSELNL